MALALGFAIIVLSSVNGMSCSAVPHVECRASKGRQAVFSAACRRRRSRAREAAVRAARDQEIRALLTAALFSDKMRHLLRMLGRFSMGALRARRAASGS